ncbi:MAG: hypothetical protein HKO95_01120 [Rhodobacteraceae bacterium]|nr:hypothetical protein [Alphaproteobacteria bacterium]NNF71532.1 hypothetical protein [Paracoccaceae bacterium]NNK65317.1 hypothetical protein [Paracoccaceae bacterium]
MTDKKDIGYGRPPVDTRWKKGQSGNPKGRPKSRPENLADAAAILAEPVTAQTPDGRRIRLDAIEAGYLALCRKGLKEHKPSLLEAIQIMLGVGVASEEEKEMEEEVRRTLEKAKATIFKLSSAGPED